jgi:hypothetical protein
VRRSLIAAVCGLILLVVGGFEWWHHRDHGLPGKIADLRSVCTGKSYADAAAYSGPAPHPIAIILASHGSDFGDAKQADDGGAVPNKVTAPYQSTNTHRVQLVACGAITHEEKSGPDCKFSDTDGGHSFSVPLHGATYRVTVYELRTHRTVGQVTVKTLPGFGYRCPLLLKQSDAPDRFLDDVDLNQWISSLEKYVSPSH